MQINYEALPDNATDQLRTFVEGKVQRLGKFYDRIVEIDVYLRKGNDPQNGCVTELRVNVPNDTLFCEEEAPSFEESTDKASRVMERQIKKFKEKIASFPQQY